MTRKSFHTSRALLLCVLLSVCAATTTRGEKFVRTGQSHRIAPTKCDPEILT